MRVSEVHRLSDDALRVGLRELVAHDRTTTVRLLIHLGEFTRGVSMSPRATHACGTTA